MSQLLKSLLCEHKDPIQISRSLHEDEVDETCLTSALERDTGDPRASWLVILAISLGSGFG